MRYSVKERRRKGRKAVLYLTAAMFLCIFVLAGCQKTDGRKGTEKEEGTGSRNGTGTAGTPAGQENGSGGESAEKSTEVQDILETCDIQGSVTELLESGYRISKVYSGEADDGGAIAWEHVEGQEQKEDMVTVSITGKTACQLLTIDRNTYDSTLTDCGTEQIKKGTQIAVFGDMSDDVQIKAERIVIVRFQ
ncbi:hypothetical protein [Qiania dongpingensis]|uniref:Uncharacterized protein n=1 Tax=Qiania dongpingensis TaxID=2763669 RepID=A0A7G9G1V0_9FIRM|nr:hypothetical protein [Qiania dongpingensis]QNM04782.1 hypothetical protein H9Q78_09990 [Qiania dongpingensis]